jgi:glycosyltransferase involved in cell wall biosynthesis
MLVVAGAEGWGDAPPAGEHIRFVGKVDDETLLSLYQNAECLALVSVHEGFGLPALEAMAAGTPVVASFAGALPEIVGDAGVLVDPLSVEAIAAGINEARQKRPLLVQRGKERAARHTWAATAQSTVDVYRELL